MHANATQAASSEAWAEAWAQCVGEVLREGLVTAKGLAWSFGGVPGQVSLMRDGREPGVGKALAICRNLPRLDPQVEPGAMEAASRLRSLVGSPQVARPIGASSRAGLVSARLLALARLALDATELATLAEDQARTPGAGVGAVVELERVMHSLSEQAVAVALQVEDARTLATLTRRRAALAVV